MKILTIAFTSVLTFATVGCMFFSRQPTVPASCPNGIPQSTLESLSRGVANTSTSDIFGRLLPAILRERVPGTQGNFIVRQFIKNEMSSLGWTVEEDIFSDHTPYGAVTFSNVIATFDPSKAKRIVIACHYDSKYMPGATPFVAATDSAVPCAIMLDSARRINQMAMDAQTNHLSDFSFQFIFFDGEEAFWRWSSYDSLYGSRHLAQIWSNTPDTNDPTAQNRLQNIDLFVLLDLIGTSDTKFANHFSNTAADFNTLVNIERCLGESGYLTSVYRQSIFQPYGRTSQVQDDHIPFLQRGVPVVHLISTPFPTVWHTPQDDLQHLDVNTVDDFGRIFRVYLASFLIGV
ncbi:hypothetical protein RRG08_042616 [Elysia crispata]|uniref:Glutaminyl-peptide cyclotransferase n=1 Tax=Elysia crispata TaxID=231223 RepID=A0AAE0XQ70_9GAST|nr:hypothetical protein RRG08_042616 [Elysia crispata]